MIVGMGMDLCEIDRIEAMVERWGTRFTEKLFTRGEREYAASKVKSGQHYAARFAVKEATLKALCVPKGLDRLHVTISHAAGLAVAVVVAERD